MIFLTVAGDKPISNLFVIFLDPTGDAVNINC
jgi:hypothetical protein